MAGDGNNAVSVLEAGLRAGAKYVLEASYKKGLQRGWDAGWADGWEAAIKNKQATSTALCMQLPQTHDRDDISNEHTQENTTDNHDINETPEEGEEGPCVLQLNDDWARLFAQGAHKRRTRDRHKSDGADVDTNDNAQSDQDMDGNSANGVPGRKQGLGGLDLGGVRKRQRTDEIQRLYGTDKEHEDNGTKQIAAIETRLDSRFQQQITQTSAVPWPYV